MRGLKLDSYQHDPERYLSHLLQMRGLKQQKNWKKINNPVVASFTDAWIETRRLCDVEGQHKVASFTDAWIET